MKDPRVAVVLAALDSRDLFHDNGWLPNEDDARAILAAIDAEVPAISLPIELD